MTRITSRWSSEPLQISTGLITKARAKWFNPEGVQNSRSKLITEDELKLVHMTGLVDSNMEKGVKLGFLQQGVVASLDDMDSDVASYVMNLSKNLSKEGGNDEVSEANDQFQLPLGPIT
ncbi:hypothetical protein FNV43_RR07362 [Rhamnella rubrinervis]|uniref:Uncharacterized protein n=1 Tax=Rhamnella rubrinervis TaxID=2594499 RepID=A0A8K0MMA6_9ROSA|nr:hypothetical protein FNV43_RR07362 [Rhamnella rubrinervis]